MKPELRVDRGSPNTSRATKEFFRDIEADLSFARVRRPADNARTERFYRTIKQEEIYVVGDYQDPETSKEVIVIPGRPLHLHALTAFLWAFLEEIENVLADR